MTSRSQGGQGGAAVRHTREEIATAIQLQGLKPLEVPAAISISDLANIMDIGGVEIIKELMRSGYMYNINEVIDIFNAGARLPDLHEGDVVAILSAGAYASSMASDHCMRRRAPEVMVRR